MVDKNYKNVVALKDVKKLRKSLLDHPSHWQKYYSQQNDEQNKIITISI